MKVLVTGALGQLGREVTSALAARNHESVAADLKPDAGTPCLALDVTDARRVNDAMAAIAPDAVIHCAAWTAVDAAETPENAARARAINEDGTANIAGACGARGIRLLYLSTDYVFDGSGERPWKPDGETYRPLNVYGRTKLGGERAVRALAPRHFIVRTAWLFGVHGDNFVRAMLRLAAKNAELRVVDDQIGAPTYAPDLARLLVDLIGSDKYGNYHATNEGGYVSRYDFAREILRLAGADARVTPVSTADFGATAAARPLNGRLDTRKIAEAGFQPLPERHGALARYLNILKASEARNGTT